MQTITITESVHNALMKKLEEYTKPEHSNKATCYLAGEDKKGIIRHILLLRREPYAGCSQMPRISSKEIAKKLIMIMKRKLQVTTFIRVGNLNFNHDSDTHDVGHAPCEIREMGGQLLSINSKNIVLTTGKYEHQNICYKIVGNK